MMIRESRIVLKSHQLAVTKYVMPGKLGLIAVRIVALKREK
jgi:hypothetical protein